MVVSFAVLLVWNAVVQRRSRTMSQKTFQLQNAFLIALIIQIIVPLCTFLIPAFYMWIAILVYYYDQSLNNFAVCLLSMHGFLSSVVMVLVHRPYRKTLLSFLEEYVAFRYEEHSLRRILSYRRDIVVEP
ncbi:unnamed protein product [Caenorhabditis nigoni]